MADRPSEPAVDTRLREYMAVELRKAEVDFPYLAQPERLRAQRRLPFGIFAAVVVALGFAALVSRFPTGSPVGTGGIPTATAIPSASAVSSEPTASTSAAPSAHPGSGIVECGRISTAACLKSVALARAVHEADVVGATRIVVDDTCPPTVACDRRYPFDSVVVFVTAGADTTGWYAFSVVGLKYDAPTDATRWRLPELPAHVVQILQGPQPTP